MGHWPASLVMVDSWYVCYSYIKSTSNSFQVVLIIRFSILPSHFSTAVFSTCKVKFWHFAIATFLTLPKEIILVYAGFLLVQETKDSTINAIVLESLPSPPSSQDYIYTSRCERRRRYSWRSRQQDWMLNRFWLGISVQIFS